MNSILLSLLFGLSMASPSSSLSPRQSFSTDPNADCGLQAFGYGPPSAPPTDTGFTQSPVFQYASLVAATPSGYSAAFRNQTGSSQQAGYLGYYILQSYNTTQCAQLCNGTSSCEAFNIYFERDPLQKPASACPNPLPTTNIKCAIYSQNVSASTATNMGQYRQQFHVVIAGSAGFNQA